MDIVFISVRKVVKLGRKIPENWLQKEAELIIDVYYLSELNGHFSYREIKVVFGTNGWKISIFMAL